ncbi:hypothetical protein CRYUN_Cryun26dG0130800 [Craigia yunnanensis]
MLLLSYLQVYWFEIAKLKVQESSCYDITIIIFNFIFLSIGPEMDGESWPEFIGPEDVLQPLLSASNSSSLKESLEILIKVSRTTVGRAELTYRISFLLSLSLLNLSITHQIVNISCNL